MDKLEKAEHLFKDKYYFNDYDDFMNIDIIPDDF